MERDQNVGPLALVALVADGEVEDVALARDGVAHQFVEMSDARPETRDRTGVVARKDVGVAPVKDEAVVGRRGDRADFEAAEMGEIARRRAGGKVDEQIAEARPREQVLDAHGAELLRLLGDQNLEVRGDVRGIGRRHEPHFPHVSEAFSLGAVAPARRRRSLAGVE